MVSPWYHQTDLLRFIAGGENSRVEFMRDNVQPGKFATVLAGLLNLDGGHVLLGVEDDGCLSGLSREIARAEEWVMQAACGHLSPPIIPNWEVIESDGGIMVGIVTVPANAPDKPYKSKQGSHWVTKVRVGTTTRDATREEEQRLYQQSGGLRYGLKPVPGASAADLDTRRLEDYFVRRNTGASAALEDGRRVERPDFPESAVREVVVNALVHRDYSITGTDVLLSVFGDRIEVQSPGSLPNTISVEGMREGARYARNQVMMSIMRDYGYVEGLGMGIRRQVIPAMAQHNGTEPDFSEDESRFTVSLRK